MNYADRFPRVSTIDAVNESIERVQSRLGLPARAPQALGWLDAYLIHLALEFAAPPPVVLDMSCAATGGASAIACVENGTPVRVVVVESRSGRSSLGPAFGEDLRALATKEMSVDVEVGSWREVEEAASQSEWPLLIVSVGDARWDAHRLVQVLTDHPRMVALVLGLGRVGDCPELTRLSASCGASGTCRPWVFRERAPGLHHSRLALVARHDHSFAPLIVERITHLFITNHDFLTLVRDASLYAAQKAVLATGGPRFEELHRHADEMRKWIDGAQDHLSWLERRIEELTAERDSSHEERSRLQRLLDAASAERRDAPGPARRVVRFARAHRAIFAPQGSRRERWARALMRFQRRVRGLAPDSVSASS